jgi:hypothetical protein
LYDGGTKTLEGMKINLDIRIHQLVAIGDEEFGMNSRVRSAIIADPWIIIILENGRVVVYQMDEKTKDLDIHRNMARIEVCVPH